MWRSCCQTSVAADTSQALGMVPNLCQRNAGTPQCKRPAAEALCGALNRLSPMRKCWHHRFKQVIHALASASAGLSCANMAPMRKHGNATKWAQISVYILCSAG